MMHVSGKAVLISIACVVVNSDDSIDMAVRVLRRMAVVYPTETAMDRARCPLRAPC